MSAGTILTRLVIVIPESLAIFSHLFKHMWQHVAFTISNSLSSHNLLLLLSSVHTKICLWNLQHALQLGSHHQFLSACMLHQMHKRVFQTCSCYSCMPLLVFLPVVVYMAISLLQNCCIWIWVRCFLYA